MMITKTTGYPARLIAPGLLKSLLLPLILILSSTACLADVYIYRGPDGERLITDTARTGANDPYVLVSHRRTLTNAGHILADRPVPEAPEVYDSSSYRGYISSASETFKVDPLLVEAVIHVESGFNPNAVSKKGATGLMQLMQDTASQYQVKDRTNPKENIYAGVEHLSYLVQRFDGEITLALAAYNAGAGNVDKYQGVPPFPETRRYIIKVLNQQNRLRQAGVGR